MKSAILLLVSLAALFFPSPLSAQQAQFGPAPDSFTDPLEKLEYYLKLLESLEQEEKKAEKENADSNN